MLSPAEIRTMITGRERQQSSIWLLPPLTFPGTGCGALFFLGADTRRYRKMAVETRSNGIQDRHTQNSRWRKPGRL